MSAGFFDTQLSRLDGALLELSGPAVASPARESSVRPLAESLMLADHQRLIEELRACRDALNHGTLRDSLTRLLSRHVRLAARLRVFASPS